MSGSYISGTGRRQLLLLPDMIENYIEDGNPARFMDSFVDSMDLGKFGFKFSTLKDGAGSSKSCLLPVPEMYDPLIT